MDYFTKLPNEILIVIFEHCKLLQLTLVCKKFNELIIRSPSLMKKLSYMILDKKKSDSVKSVRNHQGVYFKFNYQIDESSLKTLNNFTSIKSLEFMRCILPAQLFLKMLKCLPHLETLSCYTTYLKDKDQMKTYEAPQLDRLKRLNFRNSDEKFLSFLCGSRIEHLYLAYPVQYSFETLIEFLKSQHNIKSIEYLHVSSINDLLFTMITQDMKYLKKLHLQCDQLEMETVRNLELVNTSVNFLNLFGNESHAEDLQDILRPFKNIKKLELEMNNALEAADVIQLQRLTPNLEALFITHCCGGYFNHIQLPNLKILKLSDGPFTAEEWTRLANRNQSIEKLIVNDESMTNQVFQAVCLEFRNLKHLELNYDPQRLTRDILDFICDATFPLNIKFLKITQRPSSEAEFFFINDQQKSTLNERLGFNFIFN